MYRVFRGWERKFYSKDQQSWILDELNAVEISQVHQVGVERMTVEEEGDSNPMYFFWVRVSENIAWDRGDYAFRLSGEWSWEFGGENWVISRGRGLKGRGTLAVIGFGKCE